MLKEARKPSNDPIQEKLRQNKALWNKGVSAFINDIINFKKTMNGAPSKFFQEKSRITAPIPADPATIIGSLATDFQEIVQKGNSIIEEQLNYSKNRRQKQVKAPINPGMAPSPPALATPSLSTQLALWEQKYELVAEGSNKISRFFTRLFNPTIGNSDAANLRKARMSMLNACAGAFKDLEKFQVQVTRSPKKSVPEANKKLQEVWVKWTLVSRAYVIYKNSKSLNAFDMGGDIESQIKMQDLQDEKALDNLDKPVKEVTDSRSQKILQNLEPSEESIEQLQEEVAPESNKPNISNLYTLEKTKMMVFDYKKYSPYLPPNDAAGGYLNELDAAVDKFIASRGKIINGDFEQFYEKSVRYLNEEFGTTGNSFKDIINQLKKEIKSQLKPAKPVKVPVPAPAAVISPEPPIVDDTTKIATVQLEKVAQDFLRKWIGKNLHSVSLFDKTSTYRLHCYNLAEEIRTLLDQIMDLLEKGLDTSQLDPLIKKTNSKMISLRGMMRSLNLSIEK